MSAATCADNLTDAQRQAVLAFADRHGRTWKANLGGLWLRAAAGPELQQVRNELGPQWLMRVTVAQIKGCAHGSGDVRA